ncbi:MAG TPA: DUF1302 family protein, partial [Solimonas sp.]|nr:DUF1302 family protein [Solimonas sp.]
LMPVNQISMQLALDSQWTVLGQYKLEWKETELNPVGEHFSVSDVVGPGAEFIYGIDNPLFLENLSDVNILSDDVPEAVELITRLLDLPTNPLTTPILEGLGGLLAQIDAGAPNLLLPPELLSALQPLLAGAPKYINVQRGRDLKPSDHGQWGLGLKYQLTPVTNIGLYRLRYHNTTPAPVQNYGFALLAPSPLPGVPDITTEQLGLQVPVTYNIRYFDGIDLSALSFSTSLFGANIGGEVIYRDGIDVLVDVDGGLLGPVPTPTRGKVWQGLLSGLYVVGPALFWDSLTIVGETGYIHVADQEAACGPTSCSEKLTYTRDASGYAFLFLIDRKNVVSGWDLNIPVYYSGIIDGHSSFLSGLGSLMGEKDRRASIGVNLTWLQKLQVGVSVNWFLGNPHFSERPYADRDYAAFTAKYNF